MHETDRLRELPLLRLSPESFLQQRDRQVRTSAPPWERLGQEDGPEVIRDIETRIERGREVEERIQQLVLFAWIRRQLRAAVVLHRSNPVDVGQQRIVG